jgi:hypothetical protein
MIRSGVVVSILVCLLHFGGLGQVNSYQTNYVVFNAQLPEQSSLQAKLSSDSLYQSLPRFEKDLIYYMNYARQYPRIFAEKAVKPYLLAYPEFKAVYGESLLALLQEARTSGVIFPKAQLIALARRHAMDISKHDLMSHNSSDGTPMQKRFEKEGLICGSECINMLSEGTPLEVLLSLLVDYKVQNFGHRKSLLAEKMTTVGVGVQSSKKGLQYTVIDLGCD